MPKYRRMTKLVQMGNLGAISKSCTVKACTTKQRTIDVDLFDFDVIPNNYAMGIEFNSKILNMDSSVIYKFPLRFTSSFFAGTTFKPALVAIQVVYQHSQDVEPFSLMWANEVRIPLHGYDISDHCYTWEGEHNFSVKKNTVDNRGEIYLEVGSTNFAIKTIREEGVNSPTIDFIDAVAMGRIRFRMTFVIPCCELGNDEQVIVGMNFSLASHGPTEEFLGNLTGIDDIPDPGAKLDAFMESMREWQYMINKHIKNLQNDVEDIEKALGIGATNDDQKE